VNYIIYADGHAVSLDLPERWAKFGSLKVLDHILPE
jgi:hypothetical protein